MDEILIEEKKYVSSKQAAKMTGYAKDYVGQLCREGRVPARLVGRSWYVLESAIQDHRFGSGDIEPREEVKNAESSAFSVSHPWEFPRYEASHTETLPSLNRLTGEEEVEEAPQNFNDSWKEWFDHISETLTKPEEPVEEIVGAGITPEKYEEVLEAEKSTVDEDISVPVRVIHHQLPDRSLISRVVEERQERRAPQEMPVKQGGVLMMRSFQMAGMFVAAISVAIAVVGSGYFDNSAASLSQASAISGLHVYDK